MKWLERSARQSTTQPIAQAVAGNSEAYLSETGIRKLGWRNFRRQLTVNLMGQNSYYCHRASPQWKNGLWIYEGIPQIGDALMDLAPRSLFALCNVKVDLVAPPHIADLFQNDLWFDNVFPSTQTLNCENYDFAIVMSHKRRSLKSKKNLCPALPWLSIHEHFTGPEFHRAELTAQRIVDLFKIQYPVQNYGYHTQQKLKPLALKLNKSPIRTLKIGITIGGIDSKRIYQHWISVIKLLQASNLSFVLVGSANGLDSAKIIEELCASASINNKVNCQTLSQCRETMGQLDLILCCDGGLMHLALTTTTPTVCLFNALINPDWRLPQSDNCTALQSDTEEVSGIAPELIAQTVVSLLSLECTAA